MKVIATSIDHHKAEISERESFSCSRQQQERIYEMIKADERISGGVIINTCNRTEFYLSVEEDKDVDPFSMLCSVMGVDEGAMRHLQSTMEDENVLRHLCLLTAGARSQLWGDSQIITQVGEAIDEARGSGVSDSTLNTIFRLGITAGKEIRTEVDLHIHDSSTAAKAAEKILEDPEIRKVLVVGNGAIGREIAERLKAAGLETWMTLRTYHHGQASIPDGVKAVPYADRYAMIEACDAVISATASPHVVITEKDMRGLARMPRLMIDMAVPRDIEEAVYDLDGIQCYNIDEISRGHHVQLQEDQMGKLEEYIEEQVKEYHRWEGSREKVEDKIARLTSSDRDISERNHFPLFISTEERKAIVIGGGNIAERRIMSMAEFAFDITVVSEDLTGTLRRMVEGGAISWIRSRYSEEVIEDAWMVLACTNDRDLNRSIGAYCREKGKLVNVCDARNESTFWFPAMALNDELTVGIVGKGTDHMNVKKAAARLRSIVEDKAYKKRTR